MELEGKKFTIRSNHFKDVFLFVDGDLNTTCESSKLISPTQFMLEYHANGMVSIVTGQDKKKKAYMSMSNINDKKRQPEGFGDITFKYCQKRDALMCERFFLIALGENRYALESGYKARAYLRMEGWRGDVTKGKVNFQYCPEGINDFEQLVIDCNVE